MILQVRSNKRWQQAAELLNARFARFISFGCT